MACIEARGLRKAYGETVALDGLDLTVEPGRIVGLIGPNGAGKSTALQAILGLIAFEGELSVLGRDPWAERDALMAEVCFIADVAVLPRWMKVAGALDYVAGVHPRFDRAKAEALLARTTIKPSSRVGQLSKGMVTQLHLALVMAIDARLLVLDEPTLGLDLIYRKSFYDSLLNDYFDGSRTIVVSTHQVDEVEHILSDVVFIDRGRIALCASMEALETRFAELIAPPDRLAEARRLGPLYERQLLGRVTLLYDGVDRAQLARLGEVRTPGLADLFVGLMSPAAALGEGAAT
jgi:ABC-2 type transport system ATP-binding protein